MIEARIKCLTTNYYLDDLSLSLRKGQVVWLPEDQAKSSKSLTLASNANAVSVTWEERCKVAKPPKKAPRSPHPPFLKRLKPDIRERAPVKDPPIDMEEVSRCAEKAAAKAAEDAIGKALESLTETISKALGATQATIPQEVLEAALKNVLASNTVKDIPVGKPTPSDEVFVEGDEPVFIPSGIVERSTSKATIHARSEETGSDNLDEASEALKAAKRRKRKKS